MNPASVGPEMVQLMTKLTQDNCVWTLTLRGNVNARTSYVIHFADILKHLVEDQAHLLVIDLTAVEVIDAYGLRLLLAAKKEFSEQDIQIVLQNPNAHLRRLFRIMQFDRVFNVKMDNSIVT